MYAPIVYTVSNIECMAGAEGDLWVTSFEGKKPTLTEKVKPTWDIGGQFPHKLKLIKAEPTWYYERVADSSPKPQVKKEAKSYTADPAKMESIELQNNKNNAVALYCHVVEQGTPFDKDKLNDIFQVVKSLGAESYLVTEAKKMGAVDKA